MDPWLAALLGGIVGYLFFPLSVYIYKRYLSDKTIFMNLIKRLEQHLTLQLDRKLEAKLPTPPEGVAPR